MIVGSKSLALVVALLLLGCENRQSKVQEERVENGPEYFMPWEAYGSMFHDIQMAQVFEDSKTFVDCTPKSSAEDLVAMYQEFKGKEGFDIEEFVEENFDLPPAVETGEIQVRPFFEHLDRHWDYLTRSGQTSAPVSTLIPLPNQYVVPGGRFREIYYWDSYFTMIGLGVSGRTDLVKSMLDNFSHIVEEIGYIPNGNRTYFLGRSQPPLFGAMIYLYAQLTDMSSALQYLEPLQKEYDFWMDGQYDLTPDQPFNRRVVKVGDYVLNRYYDDVQAPRPESYREDVELAAGLEDNQKKQLFLDLRAACESGWDFSARWFADGNDFETIRTSQILPIDLNSILYHTELVLSELYLEQGEGEKSGNYLKRAENRYNAINDLFWSTEASMYMDYLWTENTSTGRVSAASFYPMYFKAAQQNLADLQVPILLESLLSDGGVLTTPYLSDQQWDAPNGWAPLQWVAARGLDHYGYADEAASIKQRWLSINQKVFTSTAKMMEKYNVMDTTLLAGGGEYPTQDGFGWTNGIALAFSKEDTEY